jgi:hypothetical protein
VRVIGKDFCDEEAGLGVRGLLDARLGETTGRGLSVKSRSALRIIVRLLNQLSYLSGTLFWAPWPCVFVRFLDELNSPLREGAFTLSGNGMSVKDVHNPAVPDATRGMLLTENVRRLCRRPNKRQFGDKR